MKTPEEWAIEIAGQPSENGVGMEGGFFDLFTTYPLFKQDIARIQKDAVTNLLEYNKSLFAENVDLRMRIENAKVFINDLLIDKSM